MNSRAILIIILCGLIFAGCGPKTRTRTVTIEIVKEVVRDCPISSGDTSGPLVVPGAFENLNGINVWVPKWLSITPELKQRAFDEILNAKPELDSRVNSDIKGVPPGFTVYIQDPGAFSTNSSPTLLAYGQTDMISKIWVAWRADSNGVILLPALSHELRHVYTNDPLAGH